MTLKHFSISAGLNAKINIMKIVNKVNSIVNCGEASGNESGEATGNEVTVATGNKMM